MNLTLDNNEYHFTVDLPDRFGALLIYLDSLQGINPKKACAYIKLTTYNTKF